MSFMIAGCSGGEEHSNSDETNEDLTIYTTVYPLEYVVEQIGGHTVTAHSVYPPGADGHTYEPTSKEMTEFAQADAFIYIGEGMEAFAESVADALESQDVALIEIGKHEEIFQKAGHSHDDHDHESDSHNHDEGEGSGDSITIEGLAHHYHTGDSISLTAHHADSEYDHWHWFTLEEGAEEWKVVEDQYSETYVGEAIGSGQQIKAVLYDDDHKEVASSEPVTITIDDHTEHDPHIWTDPLRVIQVAEIIKEELIQLNSEEEDLYNENFETLKKELLQLDEEFMNVLDKKEHKTIIVPHAAFGYWEERYGVKQIAISGLTASDEPSQKDLIEVMDIAETYEIEYILYEQNSENRLSTVIQEQIGAEALTIHNLEVRTEEDIKHERDYISLMEENLNVLDQVTK